MFMTLLPADLSGPLTWQGVVLTLIVTVGSVAIMWGGLWLIRELWRIVFNVILEKDPKYIEAVRVLLGGVEMQDTKVKVRAVGFGMLGTIFILAFCLAAVVWGLRFTFGGETNPAKPSPPFNATAPETMKTQSEKEKVPKKEDLSGADSNSR